MTTSLRGWLRALALASVVSACAHDRPADSADVGSDGVSVEGLDAAADGGGRTHDACVRCDGAPDAPPCPDGETVCDGRCVDLRTDALSCGACRRACGFGRLCRNGECVADTCRFPGMRCDGVTCVDLSSDGRHCGECDRSCGTLGHCEDFRCRCDAETIECAGRCVDPRTDAAHCGACGRTCRDGEICVLSECVNGDCAGETLCDGRCTITDRDPRSCGACGRACADNETCDAGECVCRSGLVRCGDECVDLSSDAAHCGACDRTCWTLPFCRAPSCVAGRCGPPPPTIACDGRCVFYLSDPEHCGGCGRTVPDGFTCREGRVTCFGGQVCDGGCHALDDPMRCGACSTMCGAETPVCQRFAGGAECRPSCDDGLEPCRGTCRDTQFNPMHCGGCERRCGARQECALGECRCAATFEDCSRDGVLVCADLRYDSSNCGACGSVCARGTYCLLSRCVPL